MIGVKSTALRFGAKTKLWLSFFYSLFIFALFLSGFLANLGIIYYIGIALASLHLGAQIRRVDIDDPAICLQVFRSNISFGWIVFASLVAGQFIH